MVFARLPTETAQCGPCTSPWRQRRVPTVAAVITRGVPLPDWYPICQFYFLGRHFQERCVAITLETLAAV